MKYMFVVNVTISLGCEVEADTLARRGLRAETEVCGTCGHAGFERGKYRCHALAIGQDADGYCCEWSSKEVEA